MLTQTKNVAAHFAVPGVLVAARPYGQGLIHESFLLDFIHGQRVVRYVLQRINANVFPDPGVMAENIRRVTQHIKSALSAAGVSDVERKVLDIIVARDGSLLHTDQEGSQWRMYRFIDGVTTYDVVTSPGQADQAGRSFGAFQRALVDFPLPRLQETIPGFHDTLARFDALEKAIEQDGQNRAAIATKEIEFARSQRPTAGTLLFPWRTGEVPERIVHNDAKISNVLFDKATDEALCVVDLDTVMYGVAAFDFGDMVRTMATVAAEDETDLGKIEVDLTLLKAVTRGYLAEAGSFLVPAERAQLVPAGRVIALEQAVRFLTDFLKGDVYYRTERPTQNLDRCRAQFRLVESLGRHEEQIRRIVDQF